MKYLKSYEKLNLDDTKTILKKGFETLIHNTHLVQDQVSQNLVEFLDNFDPIKIDSKYGEIIKFLGAGVFGSVFQLDSGKILKITFDFHEAPFIYEYCKLKKIDGFVKVDDVYNINFGDTTAYLIFRDPIEVITNQDNYREDIQKAKDTMYRIDKNWRGTHSGNFGIQNGEVVLYDGFSKNVKVNENEIPFLLL